MKIIFHGHACFELRTPNGAIIIDPFLTGNPSAEIGPEKIEVEAILLTHGHGDHVGDALQIAKKNDAIIIAPFELAMFMQKQGAKVHPMHIGGSRSFSFGKVKLTQALHGSAFIDNDGIITYTGNPCGFLLNMEHKVVYHAGDTGLFSDMKEIIGKFNEIDVALLPIGDNFVMGPKDALIAAEWLQAKYVIPMHYNTFDIIEQDAEGFKKELGEQKGSKAIILKPGESFEIE